MAIWIRADDGDWITAYTVTLDDHTLILTEKEYESVAEIREDFADKSQPEQDAAIRAMLN